MPNAQTSPSGPQAFCTFFPDTPTQSFVTTRFGNCEEAQTQTQMSPRHVVRMDQTHSAHVKRYATGDDLLLPDTDAVWTTQKDTLLLVKTADCLPLLLYHPMGVIGAIHAGRRGLETGVVTATLVTVREWIERHNDPKAHAPFWLYYGPAICRSCYQINPEIDLHMDLRRHAMHQAETALAGYPLQAIFSPFCTACRHDLFFSYRAKKDTDRLYSGIMMPREGLPQPHTVDMKKKIFRLRPPG